MVPLETDSNRSTFRRSASSSYLYGCFIVACGCLLILLGCILFFVVETGGGSTSPVGVAGEMSDSSSVQVHEDGTTTSDNSYVFTGHGTMPNVQQCNDGKYTTRTLKLAYELTFASLFRDNKRQKKYEGSSVIVVNETAYAICDSSWAVSKFDVRLQAYAAKNQQVGDPTRKDTPKDESNYEAIFYESGDFYAVRESVKHEDKKYRAIIEQLTLYENDYKIVEACSTQLEFEEDSTGLEGAIAVRDLNNEMVIMGLCEGNYCSKKRKFEHGNGRIVLMRYKKLVNGSNGTWCLWATHRIMNLPSSIDFRDYSDISMDEYGRVAITSQEDSRVWIGGLSGYKNGRWDVDQMELKGGEIYDFPKNENCQTEYCNIEGVHFLNNETLLVVSDQMKSRGRQDFRCFNKDQSVHVFVLPE
jgi:hypothetical protein